MIQIRINSKILIFGFGIAAVIALLSAYISQYIFGFEPCELCLWQRKPFFLIIFLGLIVLLIPKLKKYQNHIFWLIILLLFINSGIAFYHFGVEKSWFEGLASCSGNNFDITNIEALKIAIENTKAVRCDRPTFLFLRISMAGWNFIYCMFLVISGILIKKNVSD